MIIWDETKNIRLKLERNITFEEISQIILEEEYIDILEHSKRKDQKIFILEVNNYTHAVPFIIDEDDNIILKTAYPSRKWHKKYRGSK